jgi:PAS domain S-box-containing protein
MKGLNKIPGYVIIAPATILLTALIIILNMPAAVSAMLYILLLIASYFISPVTKNIVHSGILSLLSSITVIIILQTHPDFEPIRWIASTVAYAAAWGMMFYLSRQIEALQVMRERLDLAVQGSSAGIWDWLDINRNKEWWSPTLFNMLGLENNEIKPSVKEFKSRVHPDDLEKSLKEFEHNHKSREPFQIEFRLRVKSGEYKWFLCSGQTKFNEKGQPARMVGLIIDINEQKKAKNELTQQAALIDTLPDSVVLMDMDKKVLKWNKGAEKLYDIKAEDAIGKNLDELMTIVVQIDNGAAQTDFSEDGIWRGEVKLLTCKGKELNMFASARMLTNMEGQPSAMLSIGTDISLLKINQELRYALEKVERYNSYLQQFAYISSHDLKAPIITMQGLINYIEENNGIKDEQLKSFEMLKNTAVQMHTTNTSLNNILKLLKNLTSKNDFPGERLNVNTVITEVTTALQGDIAASGAQININNSVTADFTFPYVFLKSITYNLLSNAIKYRDTEKPLKIDITTIRTDDHTLLLSVKDNGLGFDYAKNKEKLFGIFKRFHNHVDGSGVGLHIIKSIADAYGGKVDVTSAPGQGTTFTITLNEIEFYDELEENIAC